MRSEYRRGSVSRAYPGYSKIAASSRRRADQEVCGRLVVRRADRILVERHGFVEPIIDLDFRMLSLERFNDGPHRREVGRSMDEQCPGRSGSGGKDLQLVGGFRLVGVAITELEQQGGDESDRQ